MSSAVSRPFSLGAILTVTTDRILAEFAEVHELLDFMTGDRLFTHQIPRAAGECKAELLRQHPELNGVEVPAFAEPAVVTVPAWVAEQGVRFGSRLDLTPLPARCTRPAQSDRRAAQHGQGPGPGRRSDGWGGYG